ncbi:MAPEG family protein [Rubellimicrobium roseum]|uniref:MAPEG family protein n=1 Tax=Rubellimicrobium roseum TaxID=687525 RepID=UPI001C3F407B|nr:MAPEG family protein [Rubellimicrobium roseum]
MALPVTSLYAALLTTLFLGLTARVILYRRGRRISLGDGGDPEMLHRLRAQGNCAEYAPLGIMLLGLLELADWGATLLHGLGLMLLSGRLIHSMALAPVVLWDRFGLLG